MSEPSDQSLSEDEEFGGLDTEIDAFNNSETAEGLPEKSEKAYWKVYDNFNNWRSDNNIKDLSEETLLKYFKELSTTKPGSLWSNYSMLNRTLKIKDDVSIKNYPELCKFLKDFAKNYKPVKRKQEVFTMEEIAKFMKTAPNRDYLVMKVSSVLLTFNV